MPCVLVAETQCLTIPRVMWLASALVCGGWEPHLLNFFGCHVWHGVDLQLRLASEYWVLLAGLVNGPLFPGSCDRPQLVTRHHASGRVQDA
jgi:hypothetical protein